MSEETAKVYVKVFAEDEQKLLLILPGDGWTYEEAKIAKAVSDGMAPAEIEASLTLNDPDAWMAVLRVSYLRANREFPQGGRLAQLNLLEFAQRVNDALREAAQQLPPTKRNENEPSDFSEMPELEPKESEVQS